MPASTTETIVIRGLRYNIRHWARPERRPFPAAWLDGCLRYLQFVVDALQQEWHLIAPDWRGYGDSQWLGHPLLAPRLLRRPGGIAAALLAGQAGADRRAQHGGEHRRHLRRLAPTARGAPGHARFPGAEPDPAIDAAQHWANGWTKSATSPGCAPIHHAALARRACASPIRAGLRNGRNSCRGR